MTLIADTSRIRAMLDWTPPYDDLETICAHAGMGTETGP
jgi:UDP-glucose 4-epimerase